MNRIALLFLWVGSVATSSTMVTPKSYLQTWNDTLSVLSPEADRHLGTLLGITQFPLLTKHTLEKGIEVAGKAGRLNGSQDRILTLTDEGISYYDAADGAHLLTTPLDTPGQADSYHSTVQGDRLVKVAGRYVEIFAIDGTLLCSIQASQSLHEEIASYDVSTDGIHLATSIKEGPINIWDYTTGECVATHTFLWPRGNRTAYGVCFTHAPHELLISLCPGGFVFWDWKNNAITHEFEGKGNVSGSKYGRLSICLDKIASLDSYDRFYVHRSTSGRPLMTFGMAKAFTFDCHNRLVLASDKSIMMYGPCLKVLSTLPLEGNIDHDVKEITVNRDGTKAIFSAGGRCGDVCYLFNLYPAETCNFLSRKKTLSELFLLYALNEALVAQRLFAVHGRRALYQISTAQCPDDIRLDLRPCSHLRKVYLSLPESIRQYTEGIVILEDSVAPSMIDEGQADT